MAKRFDVAVIGAGMAGASLAELEALLRRGGQILGWEHLGELQEMLKRAKRGI